MGGKRRWDGAVDARKRKPKSSIWSNTPIDIQRRLLHFLPAASFCRFKSVSKSWHSAILDSTITIQWYVSPGTNGLIRFLEGASWKTLNLPRLNKKLPLHVSSSAGLVLACEGTFISDVRCLVFNPLVPSLVRELSPLTRPDIGDFHTHKVKFSGIQTSRLSTSSGKVSFVVVYMTERSNRFMLHVYDSRTSAWEVSEDLPLDLQCDERVYRSLNGDRDSMLLRGELFYFLTVQFRHKVGDLRSLKSVNIWDPKRTVTTLATWKHLPLNLNQNPHYHSLRPNSPSLIFLQGKFVLVNMNHQRDAIGFVYLDEESRSWREMASLAMSSLPEVVQQASVNKMMSGNMKASAADSHGTKVALYISECQWGCIFDLANGTWRPVFEAGGEKGRYEARIFHPFQPSLHTDQFK